MTATDESVIKKRLLIEGDGGGDDKRISTLLKAFVKWASSSSDTKEENERAYEKLRSQLAAVEFNFAKSNLVFDMNVRENDNYEDLYARIDADLRNAVGKIEDCKAELEKAKVVRKNRQEYDALAKIINEHPDRRDTIERIRVLEKEHNDLRQTNEQLERKLEQRKRQFHLLVTSIHQLQSLLDEDEGRESDDETTTDAEGEADGAVVSQALVNGDKDEEMETR